MIWQSLKFLISRVFFVYLICILIVWSFVDFPKLRSNAVVQTMNRFGPSVQYFQDFIFNKGPIDAFKLERAILYHKKVAEAFPYQKAEAYAMLAFLYDLSGDSKNAIRFYKASAELNSDYFWPFYNLGIHAYNKKKYDDAIKYFKHALNKSVDINMALLTRSKVYSDVRFSDSKYRDYNLYQSLNIGRENAFIFMMESLFQQGNYRELLSLAIYGLKEKTIDQNIFYYYAGKATYHMKSYNEAFMLLTAGLPGSQDNADILTYLGLTMQALGNQADAQVLLNQSKELKKSKVSIVDKHLNTGIKLF